MKTYNCLVLFMGLTGGLITGMAHAQPQPPPQQMQQMLMRLQNMTAQQRQAIQQMLQNMAPEQRQQMLQQAQQMMQNMAPEQRQQVEQQMQGLLQTPEQGREAWIRQVAGASGFKEVELQNTIIAFIQAQEKARAPLRVAASDLSKLLINPAIGDEQLKTSFATYRDSMAKDQERYTAELALLDEKIKYSTQPRLEMLLGVLGIVGGETATLGGVGAIFPDSGFGGSLMTTPPRN